MCKVIVLINLETSDKNRNYSSIHPSASSINFRYYELNFKKADLKM